MQCDIDIVAELHGVRVPAAPHLTPRTVEAIRNGLYERPEIEGVLVNLRSGARVVELGSGAGIVSSIIARNFDDVKVRTFGGQPQPDRAYPTNAQDQRPRRDRGGAEFHRGRRRRPRTLHLVLGQPKLSWLEGRRDGRAPGDARTVPRREHPIHRTAPQLSAQCPRHGYRGGRS